MTTLKGSMQFTAQDGGKGYFAGVQLNIEIEEGERSLEIRFEDETNDRWKEAAIVGIRNAWRQVPAKFTAKSAAVVTIVSIDSQPADTTDMSIVFASANAVFDAFDVTPRQKPEFVQSFGCFLFPK